MRKGSGTVTHTNTRTNIYNTVYSPLVMFPSADEEEFPTENTSPMGGDGGGVGEIEPDRF